MSEECMKLFDDISSKINSDKYKLSPDDSRIKSLEIRDQIDKPLESNVISKDDDSFAEDLCEEFDRLSVLLTNVCEGVDFIEDKKWKLNYEREYNFIVPEGHIVISNTLTLNADKSMIFKKRIKKIHDWIVSYVDTDVSMYVISDAKYEIKWLLFVVEL
jgi:hypothetical protein